MVKVENLYHDYEGRGSYAVENVSFNIEDGEIFGFLGPSGAGKSTVQNIMTKLLSIQQGNVYYDNRDIRELDRSFLNNLGYSFEHPNLYGKLSAYENLKYFARLFSVPTEDPAKLLSMVGLESAKHKRVGRFSKGMKQRLVFARSIINKPQILFLDEPLSGLDPSTADILKEIIISEKQRGATILLTTHDMYAADELCDRVAFIHKGRVIAQDSPRNLKLHYAQRGLKVEYKNAENQQESVILDLNTPADRDRFNRLIDSKQVETVHSQEASLEYIFKTLTGSELTQS